MKESLKDILRNDLIEKTKATFHDMVSGVKNIFRHTNEKTEKPLPLNLNNHLKSPDEIEAEFRSLSADSDESNSSLQADQTIHIKTTEVHFTMNVISETLPEYMEENY